VYWEPLPGSGERFCAIVIICPDQNSRTLLAPTAHVVISARRLRTMLGAERGGSAYGILAEAATFMTRRLHAGAHISETQPPFRNFALGPSRAVRGFTPEQVVDTAVRLFSAFGNVDDVLEDAVEVVNHSTATTRAFLERVQTSFAPHGDEKRKRFLKSVPTSAGVFTLDYAFNQHLVQFVSAPLTERQALNMRREAESKILEGLSVQKTVMQGQGALRLIINTTPLYTGALSQGANSFAEKTLSHYHSLAKLYHLDTAEASSHEIAAITLATLG